MKVVKSKILWRPAIFSLLLLLASNVAIGQKNKATINLAPVHATAPEGSSRSVTDLPLEGANSNANQIFILDCCFSYPIEKGDQVIHDALYDGNDIRSVKVQRIKSNELKQMPRNNLMKWVELSGGAYVQPRTGQLKVGGSRPENTLYVIDGIMIPNTAPSPVYGRGVKW